MRDRFGREINYLRISVTDRCNLRCVYCMPEEGVELVSHDDILSFEEIAVFVRVAAEMGFNKVRLTGGEPLVREDLPVLVAMLSSVEAITDLSMTTNGVLLSCFARDLKTAGLMRVNVSLDTVDSIRFREFTRGGDVSLVFEGIEAAMRAGLSPVKLNCVVAESPDEEDAQGVARFAAARGLEVRFIKRMNLANGEFSGVAGGSGGDCRRCSRLRLTSNGMVRPCLFGDIAFSARAMGARAAIARAIAAKPESGRTCQTAAMYAIGG